MQTLGLQSRAIRNIPHVMKPAQPDMSWTRSHPEKREEKEDWTRDEWGNHLADKMAGACSMEVLELTNGRAVHLKVTAREALLSLFPPHQWYIEDPVRGPA